MTSRPPKVDRTPEAPTTRSEIISAAADVALDDAYRRMLALTGGNEIAAASLVQAWAQMVGDDWPGIEAAVRRYTIHRMERRSRGDYA